MKKSLIEPMPEYFDRYIGAVEDVDLEKAWEKTVKEIMELDIEMLSRIGSKTYAENKWTIHEILQHLIDVERILSFRTLLIARKDLTTAPGFDEVELARNSKANSRTLHSILEEMLLVRKSTISLFNSFDDETLLYRGYNWKYEINVLAMGFIIAGHQSWHLNIIKERYYPLIDTD